MTDGTDVTPLIWTGDAMNRRPHAVFLTRYIESRMAEPNSTLTIALDADWGAGKTFFVQKWVDDLRADGRGALVFDAWKNDMSSDPVLGFMAELQSGMQVLRKKVPATSKASKAITNTASSMFKAVRKAVVPATTVLAGGLLKKATGIAADEMLEAIKGNTDAIDFDLGKMTEAAEAELEKSLDLFFKRTLEDHRARTAATATFRLALQTLVKQLREADAIRGPLYVFVDELDRCRPDYAIRLLEGIKHLFAVEGVVFVISTNMRQLSKSVQAVYGPGFDGSMYLQRFFDFESSLPTPDNYSFALKLIRSMPAIGSGQIDFGLQDVALKKNEPAAVVFSAIADSFELPLRTQQVVFMMSSAAVTAIAPASPIALIWLYFLVALRQSRRDDFDQITKGSVGVTEFGTLLSRIGKANRIAFPYSILNSQRSNYEQRTVILSALIRWYFEAATTEYDGFLARASQATNYPDTLGTLHLKRSTKRNDRSILFDYFDAVSSAGLLG
ncbi:KAP family P-loop NTPase fold protein [Variovorax sp. LT1R20]|uniref:KAP family P-loop NTPase fold protein n=1 Tax=Variovorax sp. LT1R20 TaxID=3443729 RepID=UPI003F45F63A